MGSRGGLSNPRPLSQASYLKGGETVIELWTDSNCGVVSIDASQTGVTYMESPVVTVLSPVAILTTRYHGYAIVVRNGLLDCDGSCIGTYTCIQVLN